MNDDKTDYYHRSKDYVGQEVTIGEAGRPTNQVKEKSFSFAIAWRDCLFPRWLLKPNFYRKIMKKWGLKIWYHQTLESRNIMFVTGIVKEDERSKFGYELILQTSKWLVNLKITQSP